MQPVTSDSFSSTLTAWYNDNHRWLPWRETKDPYQIWLSEVILQQTRVAQGLPYYERFIERYPTVVELAAAQQDEVMRLWQGLGYYSRARNLLKCARVIAEEHGGRFPQTMEELKKLPGIGRYTAAAIASLAFNEAVPVVDGNVYRLLARYFGIATDISSSRAFKEFYALARYKMSDLNPGLFNQAMMEFGATQCLPSNPDCASCILSVSCQAFDKGLQKELPVKSKKTKIRKRNFTYILVLWQGKILMRQRQSGDIWQGLYEFVLQETDEQVDFQDLNHPILKKMRGKKIFLKVEDKVIRHSLSHQELYVNFVVVEAENKIEFEESAIKGYQWYTLETAERLPKPVLISNYLDTFMNSIHLQ